MSLMLKKKGGRSFAPKLPVRRPAAPSSAQSSARPSVERQSKTPVPHAPPETITIPDDDDETHAFTNDPSSRTVETTPRQPPLEKSQDPLPHAHPTSDSSAQNNAAYTQSGSLPPDKQSLKRKTREHDVEVDVPAKRHRVSNLDAPRSPPQSLSTQQSQNNSNQSQLAQSSESPQLSTPETTQQPSQPSHPKKAVPPTRANVPVDGARREVAENAESTQVSSRVSSTTAAPPNRRPLPETTKNGPASATPDPETAITGLGPAGAASGLGAAGDVGIAGADGRQLAQTPVIVPMAPLNPDGTPGDAVQQSSTSPKKKIPKRRKVQDEDGDDVRATVEMQLNRPRRPASKKPSKKKKEGAKRNSKRAETPEGAENEVINPQAVTMADLCKDLRIGPKFSMHDELRQREKKKVLNAKLAKYPGLAEQIEIDEEGGEGGEAAPALEATTTSEDVAASAGPQMKIVDGNLVVDESSLHYNRHKTARAAQGVVEEVTENDFSRVTTSGTHMKREKAQLWDMAANEIFWKGLRMFGTDFEMIAGMFPHRTRRQIKLKFCKEEKDSPAKIDRILKGMGNAIELDTYEELSGIKLEEVADIEAERERIEAEQQAEEDRRLADLAEAERKKREEIIATKAAAAAEQATSAKRVLATVDDSDDEGIVDYGDPGEKENQPRQTQSRRNNPKECPPGEKLNYHFTVRPQAETAEELRQARANQPPKTYAWSRPPKAAKAGKATKQGGAKNTRKKKGAAPDESVRVLGDA